MIRLNIALAGAAVCLASGVQAQTPSTVQPAAAPIASAPAVSLPVVPLAPTGQAMLRVGTPVSLRMAEGLTTEGKKLRVGHRFRLETTDAVIVDGQTVIPAGSMAMGEVTDVRNKGMWGKSGRINGRILYVTANGRQIRMSGQLDDKGRTGTAGVVASVALVPIAGFFVTGTSARIPVGGAVSGFIDEDVPLSFAAKAPAPMVVGAPAGAPVALPAASAAPAGGTGSAPAVVFAPRAEVVQPSPGKAK